MKMSNLTKDKLKIIGVLFIVIWILSGIFYYLFAENKQTEAEKMYWTMWEYTENMSEEEYNETFFKEGK